jgi:hypothetical protein
MPAPDLVTLEQQLDAQLVAFEDLDAAWPKAPTAVERARIGREREKALSAIYQLRQQIARSSAHTLANAAVLLRRLAVTMETDGDPERAGMLASALDAVERAVSVESRPAAAIA